MKIAVTSQDRRTVTPHAGMCRRFRVYEIEGPAVLGRERLELPKERSLLEGHGHAHSHPHD
jgi:predicted Fe-Mo cluster-binding NifX family protein